MVRAQESIIIHTQTGADPEKETKRRELKGIIFGKLHVFMLYMCININIKHPTRIK